MGKKRLSSDVAGVARQCTVSLLPRAILAIGRRVPLFTCGISSVFYGVVVVAEVP